MCGINLLIWLSARKQMRVFPKMFNYFGDKVVQIKIIFINGNAILYFICCPQFVVIFVSYNALASLFLNLNPPFKVFFKNRKTRV